MCIFTNTEAFTEPRRTSKMKRFAKIVNNWKPLTFFAKRSILDVWQGSEYTSVIFSDSSSFAYGTNNMVKGHWKKEKMLD